MKCENYGVLCSVGVRAGTVMPKVTLNDLARALKLLETEVRKRRNYITVNEMLELAEGARASEHGRSKSDVLVDIVSP